MSAIFIDGHLAHYEVIGRGKPVLFLHGWIGSWRYWVPTMQAISTTNRAYAIDFWGFGESAKNSLYTIDDQAKLLYSFVDRIGLSQFSIVGHGFGSIVAFEFARRHPDLVDKMINIGFPLSINHLNSRFLNSDSNNSIEKIIKTNMVIDAIRIDALKNDPNANKILLDSFEKHLQWNENDFRKVCLLVYGLNDPLLKTPFLENKLPLSSNYHSILFEESGYFPMLDESSKFTRLLTEFLELSEDDDLRDLQIKEKWQRRVR